MTGMVKVFGIYSNNQAVVLDSDCVRGFKGFPERTVVDTIFQSIYFWDPSGHRLEVATWTATPEQLARMRSVAHEMVEEWSETKTPPRHTAWLHQKEFTPA